MASGLHLDASCPRAPGLEDRAGLCGGGFDVDVDSEGFQLSNEPVRAGARWSSGGRPSPGRVRGRGPGRRRCAERDQDVVAGRTIAFASRAVHGSGRGGRPGRCLCAGRCLRCLGQRLASHLDPGRVAPVNCLPPEELLPGQMPAHDARCADVGNTLMSQPHSASSTCTVFGADPWDRAHQVDDRTAAQQAIEFKFARHSSVSM